MTEETSYPINTFNKRTSPGYDRERSTTVSTQVAVCIATCRRPEGLRRLLTALDGQSFQRAGEISLRVVVVDNDLEASAQDICEQERETLRWSLEYQHEPRRGISQTRNRSVAAALGLGVEFLAFIDDDEVPQPDWLDELLRVQREYEADVVGGPVLPYFYEPVPEWVLKGKFFEQFFERPRYPTGRPIELTGAGNVLVRAEVFEKMGEIFDERIGLIGGEDTIFFSRVYQAGYRMFWADEALAYEWTPAARTNVKWLLKRAYRLGNSRSMLEKYGEDIGLRARLVRLTKGGGRIAQGLALTVVAVPLLPLTGRHVLVKALQHVCRGSGMLMGLAGVLYEEYK